MLREAIYHKLRTALEPSIPDLSPWRPLHDQVQTFWTPSKILEYPSPVPAGAPSRNALVQNMALWQFRRSHEKPTDTTCPREPCARLWQHQISQCPFTAPTVSQSKAAQIELESKKVFLEHGILLELDGTSNSAFAFNTWCDSTPKHDLEQITTVRVLGLVRVCADNALGPEDARSRSTRTYVEVC